MYLKRQCDMELKRLRMKKGERMKDKQAGEVRTGMEAWSEKIR
jgi:hypothetical protein